MVVVYWMPRHGSAINSDKAEEQRDNRTRRDGDVSIALCHCREEHDIVRVILARRSLSRRESKVARCLLFE